MVEPKNKKCHSDNPVFEGILNVERIYDLSCGGMKMIVLKTPTCRRKTRFRACDK